MTKNNTPRWAPREEPNQESNRDVQPDGIIGQRPEGQERLHKVLAQAGVASRRVAEAMIAAGRVTVNGKAVTEMGVRVDPAKDAIAVDGRPIQARTDDGPGNKLMYIALHKPLGVVSTVRDPFNRPTVLTVARAVGLNDRGVRLYPVGRLDADSTGLVLLTNDGDLTFRLTHPRYGAEKEYRVLVKGRPGAEALNKLREGVHIEGGVTAPAKVEDVSRREGNTWLRITIHEGRKRQVRLMTAAVGHPVLELQRVRFGPIELGALEPGKWRNLAVHEVHALRKSVKLKPNNYKEGPPPQQTAPHPPARGHRSGPPPSRPGNLPMRPARPATMPDRARPAARVSSPPRLDMARPFVPRAPRPYTPQQGPRPGITRPVSASPGPRPTFPGEGVRRPGPLRPFPTGQGGGPSRGASGGQRPFGGVRRPGPARPFNGPTRPSNGPARPFNGPSGPRTGGDAAMGRPRRVETGDRPGPRRVGAGDRPFTPRSGPTRPGGSPSGFRRPSTAQGGVPGAFRRPSTPGGPPSPYRRPSSPGGPPRNMQGRPQEAGQRPQNERGDKQGAPPRRTSRPGGFSRPGGQGGQGGPNRSGGPGGAGRPGNRPFAPRRGGSSGGSNAGGPQGRRPSQGDRRDR